VSAVFSLVALVVLVQLQPPAQWALDWRAPAECAQADQLQQLVEARLPGRVFVSPGDQATYTITGSATRSAPGWVAMLTVADASGAVLGVREVSTPDESCRAFEARLSLVIGLLVSPLAVPSAPAIEAPPAVAPPLPSATPMLAWPDAPTTRLHLDVDDPAARVMVVMDRGVRGRTSFVGTFVLCGPPCEVPVRRGTRLFITGPGIVTSAEVQLPLTAPEQVTLWVQVGRTGPRALASTGLAVGVLSLIASLATGLLGAVLSDTPSLIASAVTGGVGLALTGVSAWGLGATQTTVTLQR
jgi:hypothetical protein